MGDVTETCEQKSPTKSKMEDTLTDKITSIPAVSSPRLECPIEPAKGDIPKDTENTSIVYETKIVKELHKSDANSPASTMAIMKETPAVTTEIDRPAAGAGGSSTNPRAVTRGRRHVRTNLFDSDGSNIFGVSRESAGGFLYSSQPKPIVAENIEGPPQNREIFSVKGTRSIQIARHRDNVSVFPSGCMGINNATADKSPDQTPRKEDTNETSPKTVSNETPPYKMEEVSPDEVGADVTKVDHPPTEPINVPEKETTITVKPSTADQLSIQSSITGCGQRRGRPLSAVQRNPLTGVGYEEQDFIRQSTLKKKDGNPVLGHGYAPPDNRTKKVPPGGYSTGLW